MKSIFSQKKINELLHNKTLLLVITILSVFNIIGYLLYGMNQLVVIYILFSGLFYFFANKNMILVLGIPLILVNLLLILHKKYGIMNNLEGMENKTLTDASMNQMKTNIQQRVNDKKSTMTSSVEDVEPVEPETEPEPYVEESFEGNGKNSKKKYRVDYASTIEDAYDELNNVLGSEGIKNLTQDTHKLMSKQLELAESLKNMGPLVQSMAPLLKQAQGLFASAPNIPGLTK